MISRTPFLDGGDDLLRHHQVRPVADEHVDFAVGSGHLDPETGRNLVPHAGVAVLEMELLRIASPPQLVQIARQAAGSIQDDVPRRKHSSRIPMTAP